MTTQVELERALDRILGPSLDELPDRVIDATLLAIATTPQRGTFPTTRRLVLMSTASKLVAVAAATVVLVVGGIVLLGRPTGPAVGSAPPSAPGASTTGSAAPSISSAPTSSASTSQSPSTSSAPGAAFAPGPVAAGTWHSATFQPTVVLTMPAGWTRSREDREILGLRLGKADLAFTHTAPSMDLDAVHRTNAADPGQPTPVTVGAYTGFETALTAPGPGTMYFDEGSRAYDTAAGDSLKTWVVEVDGRPLSVYLSGPTAEVEAVLPAVVALLASLGQP